MIIRKFITTSIALALLSYTSLSFSGQLYRFPDENGIPTLSHSLPPSAAQKGYEILDDKTMRVLKKIAPALTEQQIVEKERQQAEAEQARLEAEKAARQAQEDLRKQTIYDHNLLASYPSEKELIAARDAELAYRQDLIGRINEKLPKLEQQLLSMQKQAADLELSGKPVSENLQKRLTASQQEIDNSHQTISELNEQINVLTEQFDNDLERLRWLLQNKQQ